MATKRAISVQRRVGDQRRSETRGRILDAARQLLTDGEAMAVITVARVAEAAGVSRATFYVHFPDKRQLIDELAGEAFADWQPIAETLLADAPPTREQVAVLVQTVVARWRVHQGTLSGLIEVASYDEDARRSWLGAIDGVAATIAVWLELVRPDLTPERAQVLAHVLAWSGERSLHQLLAKDSAGDPELAEALTELVWSVGHGGP